MLPTEQLKANNFNPNEMTDKEFNEYVADVRRRGKLPKPIVVRRVGDIYEIVDGEHGWRAAKEIGMKDVPCEIVVADDYTARLETLKRNQHGTHNKVLEGRMFEDMKQSRDLTNVQLANDIQISESTVRNSLAYARAAARRAEYLTRKSADEESRNGCDSVSATESADREIAGMKVRDVATYLALPDGIADIWLDLGGDEGAVRKFRWSGRDPFGHLEVINRVGLWPLIRDTSVEQFQFSISYAYRLAAWVEQTPPIPDAEEYVTPVIELSLPCDIPDLLPCWRDGDSVRPAITPEEWGDVLRKSKAAAGQDGNLDILVKRHVETALRRNNVDLANVHYDETFGSDMARMLADLEGAPDFIRDANHLGVEERHHLYRLRRRGLPDDVDLDAKRLAVEFHRRLHDDTEQAFDIVLKPIMREDVYSTYGRIADRWNEAEGEEQLDVGPGRRETLIGKIVEELQGIKRLVSATVNGEPALTVLTQQLREAPDALLALIGAVVMDSCWVCPASVWLKTVGGGDSQASVGEEVILGRKRFTLEEIMRE
jgi:ParB/RepB/Spo0J family partition protein